MHIKLFISGVYLEPPHLELYFGRFNRFPFAQARLEMNILPG